MAPLLEGAAGWGSPWAEGLGLALQARGLRGQLHFPEAGRYTVSAACSGLSGRHVEVYTGEEAES